MARVEIIIQDQPNGRLEIRATPDAKTMANAIRESQRRVEKCTKCTKCLPKRKHTRIALQHMNCVREPCITITICNHDSKAHALKI